MADRVRQLVVAVAVTSIALAAMAGAPTSARAATDGCARTRRPDQTRRRSDRAPALPTAVGGRRRGADTVPAPDAVGAVPDPLGLWT